jgi:flavin-dependent dehydrogenase
MPEKTSHSIPGAVPSVMGSACGALPFMDTQVLVIGAGPAGSMAALALRRAGIETVVADRHDFPRDKVCGDALLPDSLATLERMGLRSVVGAAARSLSSMRVHAPNGRYVELHGEFLSLPRRSFDSILHTAATGEGAVLVPGLRAVEPLITDGAVCGARFESVGSGSVVTIRARLTLLATGAAAGPPSACACAPSLARWP